MSTLRRCLIVSMFFIFLYGCSKEIADYSREMGIDSLKLVSFNKGEKEWELFTEEAKGDYNSDTIYLYNVRIVYNDGVKIKSYIGKYNQRDGNLFLKDSVVIITKDNDTIYTDSLFYDNKKDIIKSNSKIIVRGNHRILEGRGFVSDNGFDKVTIRGKVCVKSY